MWSKVKNLLGFHTDMPDYDIIMTRIWHDTKMQHFVAHIVVLLSEIIMVIAISVRPGGPFLNVRRTTYFFLYWSLIIVCVITMLTQRWLNRKGKDYRHFYRLELFFLAFFSFWGVGISLNDQLGGNDVTVYTYTVLVVAFISVVQPWKIGIVLLISYLLLMLLFPFFPNPMDGQQFNNIINSFFPTMTAFLIAANFYHSRIRLKKDDLTIERQYQQIKEGHDALLVTAYTDTLTGLFNRSGYTQRIQELEQLKKQNISCIYLDANGLHEINNHLGHQGGDQMLVCIATALRNQFDPNNIFRIGGDEFVVLCTDLSEPQLQQRILNFCKEIELQKYSVSVGYAWSEEQATSVVNVINNAEETMRANKRIYYENHGHLRQHRELNYQMENIILEKKDIELFLKFLSPIYNGVYMVDLKTNTARCIHSHEKFSRTFCCSEKQFYQGLQTYAATWLHPEYTNAFITFCNYEHILYHLRTDPFAQIIYQTTDGTYFKLQVLYIDQEDSTLQETMWVFSKLGTDELTLYDRLSHHMPQP